MPLNYLFLKGNVHGKLGDKESGKGFMFQPGPDQDEIIYVFRLDDKAVRKGLDMQNDKCCDALLYYAKKSQKPLLVLIELKGGHHGEAEKQIFSFHEKLCRDRDWMRAHCRALIISSKSAPVEEHHEMQKRFNAKGMKLVLHTIRGGKSCNLRDVLPEFM